jgi:NAD(P)-dependent dehydrogenase (short-subunit alcohol dehydrogenase family)
VNVSTGLARFTLPGYAAYAAMKGGVEAANTLAPGAIETDFGGGAVRDNPDLNKRIAAQTALGRVGWINGQCIEASGGMSL